jgi:hypothetical protein
MSMEVVLDRICNNDGCSSVRGVITMEINIKCVVRNFNVASRGEVRFRNQHDICSLGLYVGFDFCSMLGEPIGVPSHYF